MKLSESYLNRIIKESISLLVEEDNPAFNTRNSSDATFKKLWGVIDQKRQELHNMVFGELGEQLDDLTKLKAKLMGKEHLKVPETICTAGNKKLPANVLIVNMSSSLMCPSFYMGLCIISGGTCYAQRQENQYTNTVQPQRFQIDLMHTQMLRQYANGNKRPMETYFRLIEVYIQLANKYATDQLRKVINDMEWKYGRPLTKVEKDLLKAEHSKYKITEVRLNETGDFHCQLAVNLWAKFAKKIKRKYGVNTHAYTARNLDFTNASKHINMNYSHKGDYDSEIKPRYFIAVKDEVYDKLPPVELKAYGEPILKKLSDNTYYYKCPCNEDEPTCDRCGVCFRPNNTGKEYTIYVRYHGLKNAKGLKGAYTRKEIKPVMSKYAEYGWSTPDEVNISNKKNTIKRLNDFSGHVERLRMADKINKANNKKK